jgi:hypothetical protein
LHPTIGEAVPSNSLQRWQTQARHALDQMERAHAALGGHGPGRRYATLQINHAYLVLVASHFQGYCRDLHAESTDYLCRQDSPPAAPDPRRDVLRFTLALNLQIDSRNAQPGAIGADFNRFNIRFWDRVKAVAPIQNERRRVQLEQLNTWRNAIAHQDFAEPRIAADLGDTPARPDSAHVLRSLGEPF